MELYKLERGASFVLNTDAHIPPDAPEGSANDVYRLVKLDGMYCWCKDKDNVDYFFAAWSDVTPMETL